MESQPNVKQDAVTPPEGFLRRIRRRVTSLLKGVNKTLTVYLFNVGQGDHILIELPNGEFGIIDFYYEVRLGWHTVPVIEYLEHIKKREPTRKIVIAFICISHPDHDHMKGMGHFLRWSSENNIRIKNLWLFAGGDFDQLAARYREAYERSKKDEPVRATALQFKNRLQALQEFLNQWDGRPEYLQDIRKLADKVGGEVRVILIAPLGSHVKKYDEKAWADLFRTILEGDKHDHAERNLMSSVLLLIFHRHRLLFGGDTGEEIWRECLDHYEGLNLHEEYGPCQGSFVKVSHHGSRNSSSIELWSRLLNPGNRLFVSAGRRKNWQHPHWDTLRHIQEAANHLKIDTPVFATNICRACVLALPKNVREEHFDWLTAFDFDDDEYPEQTSNLAAYVLRFNSGSDEVLLSSALSSRIAERAPCIYQPPGTGPFPRCAPSEPL